MNIGIDARLWYESGVGRYIRNLTRGLDQMNIRQHSFTIFLNTKAYETVNFESPNFKKIKSDIPWHTLSEQFRFKKVLDNENLDLVHFPYFSYPVFYKRPFVITIHDLIIDHFPTGVSSSLPLPFYYAKRLAYKKIISSAVKNAEKIIVPSNATKDELTSHYKAKSGKIEVIYEGFDPLISENSVKEKLISNKYILYVGNAYPHKNLQLLLEAFSAVKNKIEIELVCIGRDDFFYKKIQKHRYEGVHFLHNIDDSMLFEYYKHARFFVMPSLMEGFGLPILEAMRLACPVLCSNTPALKEIGGDAVIYFDPKNIKDLEEKMFLLFNDFKLNVELIDKGYKRSSKFLWQNTVDKTLKLYESCNSLRQGQ
jgi:glycosyltransferase involved in cell wall biosynthesis